jgi:hypothetical protein
LDEELEVMKQETTIRDLFISLLKKNNWQEVSKILSGITDTNYESMRIYIRNASASELLKRDFIQAAIILECFDKQYPDKADFIFSAYQCVR